MLLLLCTALVALWGESWSALDYAWVAARPAPTTHGYLGFVHFGFRLGYGGVYLERVFHESRNRAYLESLCQSGAVRETSDTRGLPFLPTQTRFGFGFHRENWNDSLRRYRLISVIIPLWCLILPTAVMPLYRWTRPIREAWRRDPIPGMCRHCNYNLTGNVSGVCPECGTPVAGKVEVNA